MGHVCALACLLPFSLVAHLLSAGLLNTMGPLWLEYVDPEEAEGEQYAVYEQAPAHVEKARL
jgi:hypothetical protein